MISIVPVVLSGGSGTRLWPLSREKYPKQLLPLVDDQSMLQATVARMDGIPGLGDPLLVCNEEHRFVIAEQIRLLGKRGKIILEPVGRNTAPALTVAALFASHGGGDPVLVVMPADHVILDTVAFQAAVVKAARLAETGLAVTFGITPDCPESGYGYIQKGAPLAGEAEAFRLARFVEKPKREVAETYVDSGEYLWNSGMFLWRNQTMLRQIALHAPGISAAFSGFVPSGDLSSIYPLCDSISIDHAIMEKADNVVVRPVDFGWSDLGTWASLYEILDKDVAGNATNGGTVELAETNDCLVFNRSNALLALQSVSNLIVVSTPDAVLVCDRSQEQKIKQLVAAIAKSRSNESL